MNETTPEPVHSEKPPIPRATDKHPAPTPDCKSAHKFILVCAVIGAVIALLLSPIPGVSWPFLTVLEIYMFLRIAGKYYGYKLSSSLVILLVVGLVVISSILTLVFGFVVGTLAWIIGLGWLIKMLVAGLVVGGLGEGALYVLDRAAASHKLA